jgi:hypothetical protein
MEAEESVSPAMLVLLECRPGVRGDAAGAAR